MAKDPELIAHQQWLGLLQPVGLVVSAPALVSAQAFVNTDVLPKLQGFFAHLVERAAAGELGHQPAVRDLKAFLTDVLGWRETDLVPGADPRAVGLEVTLPEYHETLTPTYAVPEDARAKPLKWLLLVQEVPVATPLDRVTEGESRHWQTTPEARFERLLRETQVPIGLLSNGIELRLVYYPRGESPGHVTFPVRLMTETSGRLVFSALFMLLSEERLFSLPEKQRLPAILSESRKYQNTVSTELARQVLAALYELLRGFQAADHQTKNALLREVLSRDPDQVYAGLLTVLLRLVFLLYGEDRGLMSDDEVYQRSYSVTGLFERLRADAGRHPDTMDQRYGAWGQLLALFRMVYGGANRGKLQLPARHGYLFDPDRYPFLEGRKPGTTLDRGQRLEPPLVPDGVVYRVLHNLLLLDGERISYRALDVEQIGSVYETMMGFRLEVASGPSIAVRPAKSHGAPATINLEELLGVAAKDRAKWLKERTDQTLTGAALNALKAAETVDALVAALGKKVAQDLTPNVVPAGSMVLQPSNERRKSGSHYTPRSLTEPIVRKALEPVLQQLGESPKPDQILGLKVCDPAMGSGAFLVEACRQLGDALVKAWHTHRALPKIPPDEDELLHARRVVAQRCLYGVDKNPMAVDLSKLSLWLATLAKDHPFTFLDHALRCGDSLVGLTVNQIRRFNWKPSQQMLFGEQELRRRVENATHYRYMILETGDFAPQALKEQQLKNADEALNLVRFAGNLAVAAFFAGENDRKREGKRTDLFAALSAYLQKPDPKLRPTQDEASLREGLHPLQPFHWEVEFPEVFGRNTPGFDVIVGNPPFAGKNTIGDGNRDGYLDWLKIVHQESHGNADLVAHFFRRAFNLLRPGGTFGLIATNTIAQGDTRSTGLRWICTHGGTIYAARRRYKWPGQAAVVVSVVHGSKGPIIGPFELDGKSVGQITAYLFHAGVNDDPKPLAANAGKSYQGCILLGMGFTFDDTDEDSTANPISLMHELVAKDKRNSERIFPYIGGEELNDNPTHAYHRYVIDFFDMSLAQAEQWPDLIRIVRERVKPDRDGQKREALRTRWWQYAEKRPGLRAAVKNLRRVLVCSRIGNAFAFTFLPTGAVCNEKIVVFATDQYSFFCTIQSRVHEVWARFFSSTLKDDLQYTPSDCFETFPFPVELHSSTELETAGKAYYEFRADLMVRHNEGLTKTYNRFHDRDHDATEPDKAKVAAIQKLRELHGAMDCAVLAAYGPPFSTLTVPPCEFLLDYEDDDEEEESTSGRQRKKPWRYRWPDTFRDEVLALLLELNKQRAEKERLATSAVKTARRTRRQKSTTDTGQEGLF